MARRVRDLNLDSRAGRARCEIRPEPHWRALDKGLHLGYRRRANGGSWTARRRKREGAYVERKLGAADDIQDADGIAVLNFYQAQDAARQWFHQEVRREAGLEPVEAGPYAVSDAIRDYLNHFEARGGRGLRQTKNVAKTHIEPSLGDVEVARLTAKPIRDWHHGLATEAARVRTPRGQPHKRKAVPSDRDAKRRRQATANRVLTVLKAALNHAWHEGKVVSDDAWRRVRPFRDVDAPVVRYLTEAECARLVTASSRDFRPLVQAALLTGCRYSELTGLRLSDFNPDVGTLTIRASKSGKPRHVILSDEGNLFFGDVTAGRARNALIFVRPDDKQWAASHQQRPLAEACKRAKIQPAVSFHILRHTHGSLLAMRGVPMPVIAQQLGHADTRMTERHYAHFSPSYVATTIRANFPTLGIVEKSKVTLLRTRD